MKIPVAPFTAVHARWVDAFRNRAANDPQMIAHLEWDDEGGSASPPEKKPVFTPVRTLLF